MFGQQGGLAGMMLPLAMFAAIFYFMIMRPQKKKQQQHDNMIASISVGSEVITAGGFFGTVRKVLDDSFIIELAEGVMVRILKTSISIRKNSDEKNSEPKKAKKKKKKLRDGGPADATGESQAGTIEAAASDAGTGGTEVAATPETAAAPAPAEEENNGEKA